MNVKLLNPLTLAYMGDAVLDQHVREYIVLKLQSKPHRLHQVSKSYVSAKSQAETLEYLLDIDWFTEEELSSALEAVIGFLYLDHQSERLENLLETIVRIVDER